MGREVFVKCYLSKAEEVDDIGPQQVQYPLLVISLVGQRLSLPISPQFHPDLPYM